MHHLVQRLGYLAGREWSLAGERAIRDRRERVQIRAVIDRAARGLLGRHVRRRAHDVAGGQRVSAVDRTRDAEIEDLPRGAVVEHILWLEVSVDDSSRGRRD